MGLPAAMVLVVLAMPAVAGAQVNTELDHPNDPAGCEPAPGDCTLREAIADPALAVIDVPAGLYELTEGELVVARDVTINGAGARDTEIGPDFESDQRVFQVGEGASVTLADLRIHGGRPTGLATGGGILADAGSTLRLIDSAVEGNTATHGAGIASSGTLELTRTTVANNVASDDEVTTHGGGILFTSSGQATLENSTVSGNFAHEGAGIYTDGDLVLRNVTIAQNETHTGVRGTGGGIFQAFEAGDLTTASNTLVAENFGGNCAGTSDHPIQSTNGLSDEAANPTCNAPDPTNQLVEDARIEFLDDNGGPTDTHALASGSLAIDHGGDPCPPEDQRGIERPQRAACDIGAYEATLEAAPVLLDGNPLNVYADGAGRIQFRFDGQPAGIFFPSGANAANAGLEVMQGDTHYALGAGRTVTSEPVVGSAGNARTLTAQYKVGPDLLVDETLAYVDGSQIVNVRYRIQNTAGTAVTFRAGELADLYLGGNDAGTGVFSPGPPRFIGGTSADGVASGLLEQTPWLRYQEDHYSTVFSDFASNGLTNTIEEAVVDNGVGVEWEHTLLPEQATTIDVAWQVGFDTTPDTGTLRVVTNVVNDNGGARGPGDFTVHVRSGGADVAATPGSAAGTSHTLAPGAYTVSADAIALYAMSISGDCAGDGSVTVQGGQAKTCTITADDIAQAPQGGQLQQAPQGGQLPPPEVGETVNVVPKQGTVKIKLKGSNKFVELQAGQQIPVGTEIDTRSGRVSLTAAANTSGGTATADFYDGLFRVGQTSGSKPTTTLKLTEKLSCPKKGGKANVAARRKKKRRLWGDGSGKFRTEGSYSSATVRGTKWLTEDSCNTTLTRVARGSVSVRDFAKKKTVVVKAGKKYVAKRRG